MAPQCFVHVWVTWGTFYGPSTSWTEHTVYITLAQLPVSAIENVGPGGHNVLLAYPKFQNELFCCCYASLLDNRSLLCSSCTYKPQVHMFNRCTGAVLSSTKDISTLIVIADYSGTICKNICASAHVKVIRNRSTCQDHSICSFQKDWRIKLWHVPCQGEHTWWLVLSANRTILSSIDGQYLGPLDSTQPP